MNDKILVCALGALAIGLLASGCQSDEPGGSPSSDPDAVQADVPAGTDGTDGTDDASEPWRPQPEACGFGPFKVIPSGAPSGSSLLPPQVDIVVAATPAAVPDDPEAPLPVTSLKAFITPCSCTTDISKPGKEYCTSSVVVELALQDDAWIHEGWTPDELLAEAGLEGEPTRAYCIGIQGRAELPEGSPDYWETPECTAAQTFAIDGTCPEVTGLPEGDGSPPVWFRTGSLSLGLKDDAGVASAVLLAGDGSTVATLYDQSMDIEPDETHTLNVEAEFDVCGYGPDIEEFQVEVTDVLGQSCTHDLPIDVLPCPRFVGADIIPEVPETTPTTSIIAIDFEGDEDEDVLAASKGGVLLYENDGGRLRRPAVIPGLEDPAAFVITDYLDNDSRRDYVVIGRPGETGSPVSVYLWSPACEPDYKRFKEDRAAAIAGGDPSAMPEFVHAKCQREDPNDASSPLVWELKRAQEFMVPAGVGAHLYTNIAPHPDETETENQRDVVLGTNADATTVAVLLRKGGTSCKPFEEPMWKPELMQDDDPDAGNQTPNPSCFDEPRYFAGAGGGVVTAMVAEDFFSDDAGLTDVVVAYQEPSVLAVFRQVPDDAAPVRLVTSNPTDPMPSHAVQLITYLGSSGSIDVLALLEDAQQIWQVFSTGDALGFKHQSVFPVGLTRRVSCIEGGPATAALAYLNEQVSGVPDSYPDLVVANRDSGALWTLTGRAATTQATQIPGYAFDPTSIADGLRDPLQLLTLHVDGDDFLDVVILNDAGAIGVVYGANPTLPPADPDYGPAGVFRGARHLTTPIPPPKLVNACAEAAQVPALQISDEGLPLDRLEPQFVVKGSFDNDQYTDLAVVAERTKKMGTGMDGSPIINMTPVFFFRAPRMGTQVLPPYIPWERAQSAGYAKKLNLLPYDSRCNGEPPECNSPFGPVKGPITAVAAGPLEPGADKDDLAFATSTFYNGPELPPMTQFKPLSALDLAFTNGVNLDFNQAGQDMEPAPWERLGYIVGSSPSALTLFNCDSQQTVQEIAIVQTESGVDNEKTPPAPFQSINLRVFSTQGADLLLEQEFQLPPKVDVLSLVATRLGDLEAPTNDRADLLVSTPIGVRIYRGVDNACNFSFVGTVDVGSDPRTLTAGDLDGDGLAELVTALESGEITLRKGQDGGSQFVQMPGVYVEGARISSLQLLDVNGDGFRDILALDMSEATIYAFLHTGTGLQYWPEPYDIPVAPGTTSFFTHDFDGDGCQELVSISPTAKAVSILRNRGPITGTCVPMQ